MHPSIAAAMTATVARLSWLLWERYQWATAHEANGLLIVVITAHSQTFDPSQRTYPATFQFIARDTIETFLTAADIGVDRAALVADVDATNSSTAVVLVITDVGSGLYHLSCTPDGTIQYR
jgi:hypothetical protein